MIDTCNLKLVLDCTEDEKALHLSYNWGRILGYIFSKHPSRTVTAICSNKINNAISCIFFSGVMASGCNIILYNKKNNIEGDIEFVLLEEERIQLILCLERIAYEKFKKMENDILKRDDYSIPYANGKDIGKIIYAEYISESK